MKYKETYRDLCHGTTEENAYRIKREGFKVSDSTNWCGKGVYFYDIKKKAWWFANFACRRVSKESDRKVKPCVVFADIIDVYCDDIFDLRVKDDLMNFELFSKEILNELPSNIKMAVDNINEESERIVFLRSVLISFYADKKKCKLVVGNFRQKPQPENEHAIEFADSIDMVFGIETIYCVKDLNIISNVRIGGNGDENIV